MNDGGARRGTWLAAASQPLPAAGGTRSKTTSPTPEAWEVFARQDAAIPIRHVGRVDAATLDDAIVFATTLYEEWKWSDMFIVPRRVIAQLVKPA